MHSRLLALSFTVALAGCEQITTRQAEYRPGEGGTVDQALCLLGFTAVPLRELITGHHLVDVTLNGRTGTFVLDTGANATVVHAAFAEEFGLPSTGGLPAGAIGVGGGLRARQVRAESFAVGAVPVRQSRIMVADLAQVVRVLGPVAGRRIYGIVGQDVMKEHRAVIDVARPILYLIPADEEPAPVAAEKCTMPEGTERAGRAPENKAAQAGR